MMVKGKFRLLTPEEVLEKYIQKHKREFLKVAHVASAVDWNIYYAFFQPRKPSEREIKEFLREVEKLKKELKFLKANFKPLYPQILKAVENKLEHIVDEYKEYPFSNRRDFFRLRLKFLKQSMEKCFVG